MRQKCEKCGRYNCICNINQEHNHHDCKHEHEEHSHKHEHSHGCCEHCHGSHEEKEEISKLEIGLYIVAIILFIASIFIIPEKLKAISFGAVIILAGIDIIFEGIKNIFKLNFEETTLMTIAVIAAFILGEYMESAVVILLSKFGEFLEEKTLEKSQQSIQEISEIKEENVNLFINDNETKMVDADEVEVGAKILIKPGERVPLDCTILSGESKLDTSAVTGESKLRKVKMNDEILSGSINTEGAIVCKVEKNAENSTASQIIELVNEAVNNKGKTENVITKFSKIYTPIVMIIALIIAIGPASLGFLTYQIWIKRSLIFLVASCPCSIVISIPLAMFAGVGIMAKRGLLVKGTKHIEDLANIKIVCFDKTGTLTTGKKEVDKLNVIEEFDREKAINYMISLESLSNHPISYAILNLKKDAVKQKVENYKEIAGKGLYGTIEGKQIIFGNKKLLEDYKINCNNITEKEGSIYLVVDTSIIADVSFKDEIESSNKNIVADLNNVGVKRVVMMTGDNLKEAQRVGNELNIKEIYADLLPADKQKNVKDLKQSEKVIFVGDGINDGPVIAASDFGISMGKGTEIANNVSDSILISNNIDIIPHCIKDAKKTMRIVKFNIAFSLIVKFLVLVLGVLGIAPMWSAVVADTGVSTITILNAVRIYKE